MVASKPGRAIPPGVWQLVRRRDTPELPFHPDSHVCWSSTTGTVAFAGWQAGAHVLGVRSHWEVATNGLTAFSGYIWPRRSGWSSGTSWAAQLAAAYRRTPVTESLDGFAGIYSALHLTDDGGGHIISDPLGLGIVYTGETEDMVAFSNRAGLVARSIAKDGTEPARDALAVGWLVYSGYLIGNETGFAGVRAIPQGSYVELHPEHGSHLRSWSRTPWIFDDRQVVGNQDELFDLVRDEIASILRAAVQLPARERIADITGGKDSRLILAVLLSEHLADSVVFNTVGAAASPDTRVARQIAEQFDLAHLPREAQALSPVGFDEQLRVHVFRTSGALGAWDLKGSPRGGIAAKMTLSGLCGEVLRTNYPGFPVASSTSELVRHFPRRMGFDTLGLLRPEIRAHYESEATRTLVSDCFGNSCPEDAVDVFYIRNRLRRWFGTGQEIDRSNRIFPLYSLDGIRAAFAIGAEARHNEVIHFEVMRRCSDQLARAPFADRGWNEQFLAQRSDAGRFPPPQHRAQGSRPRQWQAVRLEENRAVFERYLCGDPDHPVFEIIDPNVARRAVSDARELGLGARIQLYGALTAALWLGHHERRPVEDGR